MTASKWSFTSLDMVLSDSPMTVAICPCFPSFFKTCKTGASAFLALSFSPTRNSVMDEFTQTPSLSFEQPWDGSTLDLDIKSKLDQLFFWNHPMEYANFLVGSIAALTGFIAFRKSFMLNITQAGKAVKEDWSNDVYLCSFFISPKGDFIDSFTVVASPNMVILGCSRNGSRIRDPEQELPKLGTKSINVPIGARDIEQFFIYFKDFSEANSLSTFSSRSIKKSKKSFFFINDEREIKYIPIMQMAFMVKQTVVK